MTNLSPPSLQHDGPTAFITLNAPERHNALSLDDLAACRLLLREAEGASGIRVLVLRASGRTFCSGHDLGHFDGRSDVGVPAPDEFAGLADAIQALPLPTICALQGSVYAGGIDIALACDFRIGVPGMRMRLPAAEIGIHLYPGSLRRYVGRLGLSAAKRICLLGETFAADELLRVGFLDRLVAAADLDAEVAAMALALGRGAPLAVHGMKAALDAYSEGRADEAAVEARYRASFRSADIVEGLNARKQRREPVFVGA